MSADKSAGLTGKPAEQASARFFQRILETGHPSVEKTYRDIVSLVGLLADADRVRICPSASTRFFENAKSCGRVGPCAAAVFRRGRACCAS